MKYAAQSEGLAEKGAEPVQTDRAGLGVGLLLTTVVIGLTVVSKLSLEVCSQSQLDS